MGLPPSAPATCPRHAGAFFHGVVGNSTESSSMPNPGRTWPGAGWSFGKMCASSWTYPAPRTRLRCIKGLASASRSHSKFLMRPSHLSRFRFCDSVTGWVVAGVPRLLVLTGPARKDVVLGEAFRGIAAARRGASPIIRKCVVGSFARLKSRCGRL